MTGVNMEQPEFELVEDDNFIKVTVPAPLSRPNSAAVVLEGNVLTFDSPPYLLKLKLPSKVLDDYNSVAFDEQKNIYTIKLKKDLDANGQAGEDSEDDNECPEDELFSLLCSNPIKKKNVVDIEDQFYGFGNFYRKMFGKYYSEFYEVIDLPDPDKTTPQKRTKLRIADENKKWNADHYLADLMDPDLDLIENYFKYKPPWVVAPVKDELRSDELEDMGELPKKDWLKLGLADEIRKICELQMIDILFAYAYNKRIMEGDDSVASAWNISKISSTLSWFETFKDLKGVVLTCYKRMITYPLCRSWKLADFVKNDVVNILKLGPKQVTRCFLEVRDIFNETENYYVLNTLFINDLCQFAYNLNTERTLKLSEQVQKIKIEKCEVQEDLPILECAAQMVANESNPNQNQPDINKLAKQLQNLKTKSTEMPSDSESDGDDCSTSSDSTEATDSSYDAREMGDEVPEEGSKNEEEDSDSGEEEDDDDDDESGEEEEDDDEDSESEEEEEDEEDDESQETEEEENLDDDGCKSLGEKER